MGYDSVWATDHIIVEKGRGWPYERVFDSVITMAYASGITKLIRFGTSVMILANRNPILTARQLATIDILSEGRAMLGVGSGYNEPEFRFLNSNFHDRGKRLNESIRVIRALWRGDTDFRGVYTQFENASFGPPPIQKELPILVGGLGINAMRRAIDLGDAWHPTLEGSWPEDFDRLVSQFRRLPRGKDKPIFVRVGLNGRLRDPIYVHMPDNQKRSAFCGDRKKNREIINHLQDLGVSHVILDTNSPNFAAGGIPLRNQIQDIRTFAQEFL